MNAFDDHYMELALKLSRRGLGRCAPNPTVGAVVVRYGDVPVIPGRGWTMPSGRPHAETVALKTAGEAARGATLYVTLEPCSHHGKTPPCVDAIIEYGVKRVVYAADDPDARVAGRGLARLRDAGIEVQQASQDCVEQAQWIMRGHILRQLVDRPFVQVKLAVDAAYRVSTGDGAPVWVTCEEARQRAHMLRAQADAILIGRGTALADNPTLTCRLAGMDDRSPTRVLLDKSLQVPVTSNLFKSTDKVPLWVLCGPEVDPGCVQAVKGAGADVIQTELDPDTNTLSVGDVLKNLADRGITRLMVEGGPTVVRSFWESGFIDELVVFQSDKRLGEDGSQAIEGIGLEAVLKDDKCQFISKVTAGVDTMKTYRFRQAG